MFARLARATRYAEPGLSENWPSIAGTEIAALCRPGRVLGNGPGRTLEVVTPNGAAATAVQMQADTLLEAVNRFLGPGAVGRLSIRQSAASGPGEKRAAAGTGEAPDAGRDPGLGAALSSFRSAVSARNPDD